MNAQTEKQNVVETYRKRAKNYDFTANLYYLIGFREWAYRKRAVAALNLSPGDTVVEIGCGTGLNFKLLQEAVGPTGKIIGVDITDAMLEQARQRITEQGWRNVELIQCDAVQYVFPEAVAGILSTFALSLVPEPYRVIESGAAALTPGKRWVVLDLKMPDNRLRHFWPIFLPVVKPFAVTETLVERRPWTVIRRSIEEQLTCVRFENLYLGFAFITSGQFGTTEIVQEGA